jgi:hypothetical protein
MQRTAALPRIDGMRFDVGPKSNQLTAIGNSMCSCLQFVLGELRPRRSGASTHAGCEEVEEKRSGKCQGHFHKRNLRIEKSLNADSVDQLKFEFARNKNSMLVFMLRLGRVYHT